jgi:hypothetical protein
MVRVGCVGCVVKSWEGLAMVSLYSTREAGIAIPL